MAEEKKKEGDKPEEAKKKKGLSPLIFVAVGAVLGGAGVVFGLPPKRVEVKIVKPEPKVIPIHHPDLLEFTFNPSTDTSRGFATVNFYFEYTVREDLEDEAFGYIKANWDRAKSACLLLFSARTMRELNTVAGKKMLEKDLIDELEQNFFPGKKSEKIAHVSQINWAKFVLQ